MIENPGTTSVKEIYLSSSVELKPAHPNKQWSVAAYYLNQLYKTYLMAAPAVLYGLGVFLLIRRTKKEFEKQPAT